MLAGLVCLALLSTPAARALVTYTTDTNAIGDPTLPVGGLALVNLPSRAGYSDGPWGGMFGIYYRGDTAACNQALAAFAAVQASDHVVTVHDGPAVANFINQRMDWSVNIWPTNMISFRLTNAAPTGTARLAAYYKDLTNSISVRLHHPAPQDFNMNVYVGGGLIDWSKVKIPAGVHVHDQRTTAPLSYRDPASGVVVYVESDRHHVVAFSPDEKVLWQRTPAADGNLPHYSPTTPMLNPAIYSIGPGNGTTVGISFGKQFGTLDIKTGDFTFLGQD